MAYEFTALSLLRSALAACLLVLVVAGCTFGPTPTPKPSPSHSPTPTPSPSPTLGPLPSGVTCAGKRDAAAMVLAGNQLWDSTAPSAPVSLCTFAGASQLHFATATEVSFVLDSNKGKLTRLNLETGALSNVALAGAPRSIASHAWSPDGKNLAYWVFTDNVSGGGNNNAYQGFLKAGDAAPQKLTEETVVPGRGVGPGDNVNVRWSPTGNFVAMVNTFFNAPHLQVFRPDATSAFPSLAEVAQVRGTVMAAWGPADLLYYSDANTLRTWTPPDSVSTVGGSNIYYPTVCQGGCAVAYNVVDSSGAPKLHVQSTGFGDSDVALRAVGAFAATGHLWCYAEEMNPAGGLAPPYRRNGKLYDYNLQTKLETQLPLSVTTSDTVLAPEITDVLPRS